MSLRFPELSTETRNKIQSLIRSRAITERARRFLQLALDGVESTPPAGVRFQWYGYAILVSGPQTRLADLLDCSVKTFQRAIDASGEFAAFLHSETIVVRTMDGLPVQRLVYAILIDRLEALAAVDPTDEFEAFILKHGPGLQELRLADVVSDVASVVASDVASLMQHEHEHEHEHAIKTHAGMQHESFRDLVSNRSPDGPSGVRMSNILADHVRQIVRAKDAALFSKYFADAVAARWAKDCETDRIKMAALFHQVVRIGTATSPGRVICQAWKNRDNPDHKKRLKLAGDDENFARQLLRPAAPPSSGPQFALRPMATAVDELSASELQRQSALKAANQRALQQMAKNHSAVSRETVSP